MGVNHEDIASEILKAAKESDSEEDLRIRVESVLKKFVLDPEDIPWGKYEVSTKRRTLISGSRIDALHAHVVIEYERPGSLESKKNYQHALEQVENGIAGHAKGEKQQFSRYFGVVIDGFKIGFVRYRQRFDRFEMTKEALDVNGNTIRRLVEAINGLKRKALGADELLKDFGPDGYLSKKVIRSFYDKLIGKTSERTQILFRDWKRVFSQVCAYDPEKLRGLEEEYDFKKGCDDEKLLFSLHSYLALLMKLLAAEVGSLRWPIIGSYLRGSEEAYFKGSDQLRDRLRELEEGGPFAILGISNFLEGDYFGWYLSEWDKGLAESVVSIIKKLSDYDPSTTELEPDRVKDLFKRLYQNLVPQQVRHDLGEYYTPDWLAELVLDEAGYNLEEFRTIREKEGPTAPLESRILDPGCGSGTFLVLAIKRMREYVDEYWIEKGEALRKIVKNIVGFDLNPLAVMASRANFLIAIGDLLGEKGSEQIEIPVYLADSILVEKPPSLGATTYLLRTVAGNFGIPKSIVDRGVLNRVLNLLERCIKLRKYTATETISLLEKEIGLQEDEIPILRRLYQDIAKLEAEDKNKIWLRILKNSFAPLLQERFGYVVGNPPWINWESLPASYRESTKPIWEGFGLFTLSAREARLGGGKKDIAMLFVYTSVKRYLKPKGVLAFVITQSVFKTKGSGEGFRRFRIGDDPFKVLRVNDMVDLVPFEGAQNRTATVLLRTGAPTTYPVDYYVWRKTTRGEIPQFIDADEVLKVTQKIPFVAFPIDKNDIRSPWTTAPKGSQALFQKLSGRSEYKAWAGAYTGVNSVYWLEPLEKLSNGDLLIRNLSTIGKKKVKEVTTQVEPDLVYPLLRGRDVHPWHAAPSGYMLLTQDPAARIGVLEKVMKTSYPRTYEFLSGFEDILRKRPLFTLYFAGRKNAPFYSVYNVGNYTLAPYKVVWRYVATGLMAAVVEPAQTKILGKKAVIPDIKLMLVPCGTNEEAHYLCAVLNSKPMRLLAKSYLVETQISTHILDHLRIPRYDASNSLHSELARLSEVAHELAMNRESSKLLDIEKQVDSHVGKLYGLSEREVVMASESLALLMGEDITGDGRMAEESETVGSHEATTTGIF